MFVIPAIPFGDDLLPCLFFSCSPRGHRVLLSFPTRRSSDLQRAACAGGGVSASAPRRRRTARRPSRRSEEHTSELQSLTNLVCRVLLEKRNRSWSTQH